MPDLLDVYKGDPIAAPMFVAFVRWALGEDWIRADFEQETGLSLPAPARTPLDAMIDQACGVEDQYVMGFAEWAHDTMWAGDPQDDDPDSCGQD